MSDDFVKEDGIVEAEEKEEEEKEKEEVTTDQKAPLPDEKVPEKSGDEKQEANIKKDEKLAAAPKSKSADSAAAAAPKDDSAPAPDPFAAASEWLSAGTSWGTSWLSTAKEKTFATLEMVKKDLGEFTEAVTSEANVLTNAAAGAAKEGLDVVKQQASYLEKLVSPTEEEKEVLGAAAVPKPENTQSDVPKSSSMGFSWMKNLVDTVKTLGIEDTTTGEEESTLAIRPRMMRRTTLPPFEKGTGNVPGIAQVATMRLMQIQTSESTFLVPPEDMAAFEEWAEKFCMEEHDGESKQLLSTNPPLRALFSNTVPAKVDYQTFWMRYFFKVHLAEAAEVTKEQPFKLDPVSVLRTKKEEKTEEESEAAAPEKKDGKQRLSPDEIAAAMREQPTSPARSADDWSVCSNGERDIMELSTTAEEESESPAEDAGPLTPRPVEEKKKKEKKGDKKEKEEKEEKAASSKKEGGAEGEEWVNWDE